MANLPEILSRLLPGGEQLSATFAFFLLLHVLAGLTGVATGAVAAISIKRPGRHPKFGTAYYSLLSAVFLTAVVMSALHWPEDLHLLALGTIAFGFASIGLTARKIRWRGWKSFHILGMSASYVTLLTAFYVDNGPRLPLVNHLPTVAFWTLPSLVGVLLVVRAVRHQTKLTRDLRFTSQALKQAAWERRGYRIR